MRHWIFKTSPDKYDIERRFGDPLRLVTWKVNDQYRTQVGIGDIAFIFRTGTKRAVLGALRVTSEACLMEEIETELPFCREPDASVHLRVIAEITHRCSQPITAAELKTTSGLENLSVFDPHVFQMATTFPITEAEAAILSRLVASR
jgi:hypothetical protein